LPLYQTHQTLPLFFNHNNKKLKIISANVYRYNTNYSKTIDLIMKNAPDIVALIETDKNWIKGVRSIEKIYPYFVKEPRDDKFGLAIYSKLPFQVRIEEIGFYQLPLAILDFKNFKLIIAHPIAPVSPLRMYDNKQYIKMIAQIVKRSKKSVIVAGDLNATFWSDSIKPLFNSGLERMNSLKSQHTWPTHLPFLGIQIDHFLAKGIKKTHFQVLSDIGSDHYPIQGMIETIDSPE
jgi:endonuclease/exonuclease/phosphatase (EEP) superfamily protein YafD